ncbi:Hsp20/alpha crystallin family protein [Streptomyces sp. NPDC006430]|uniref:Hsp20/alpha crystallin family protein n=1 Tax=Streptomyces sp. NPDC006430 TaxID=3154299 RepID=UPI0033A7C19D
MSGSQMERRRSRFPDFRDWFGTEFPGFPGWRPFADTHTIAIEVSSEGGQYTLRAELPGMDPDKDIRIEVEGDTLTVSAEHTESTEEKDHSEFRYGSFRRMVRLPARIVPEDVQAEYHDGILTVRVPMQPEAEGAVRSIPVKRAKSEGGEEQS